MTSSRRDIIIWGGCALMASMLPARAACEGASPLVTLRGPAFGTSWSLLARGPCDGQAIKAAFENVISSVDIAMSPFQAESEISRFNGAATTDWYGVSADTITVVEEAIRIASLTDGGFNPTVGPIVGRFGFGPILRGEPGSMEDIAVDAHAIRKSRATLSLDLCGIAKGYALDRMVATCRDLGITDLLVELGGEVRAAGFHPFGRRWQVGVERPSQGGFSHAVSLEDHALATSGKAVNAYAFGSRTYSHIIDPATGLPASNGLASVTVAAGTAMTADALATALYALGAERGPDVARRAHIEALFIMDAGNEVTTGNFDTRILG
ncbi:MAG: FAD:protein FMN transferase [Pseudaminobacter sp.]